MSDFLFRARGLFRWSQVFSCSCWPVAIALVFSQLDLVERYVPLPSSFVDIASPLAFAGYVALKVLAGWSLIFLLAGVLPYLLWGEIPLKEVSLLVALLAVLFVSPSGGGFTTLVTLSPLALAVVIARWAGRRGADVEHWFYRVVPLGALALCALGFAFLWAGHFPLRVLGGRNPILAAVLLVGLAAAILLPVLRRAPGRLARLLVLGGAAIFLSTQGRFVFEENYRLFPYVELSGAEPVPRHIVLIVIDTLRADALDLRDPQQSRTPHIAALAAESVVFVNAIAPAPWTYPSMVSLMTGIAPLQDAAALTYATARLPTLAQYLQRRGYYTRGIVGNHLLYRPQNVAAGFHRIETYARTPVGEATLNIGLAERLPERFAHGGSTRYITDRGIDWIERSEARPSFLWLHYFDPHDLYLPPVGDLPRGVSVPVPQRFSGPRGRAEETAIPRMLYDAEVRFVDRELGRFLAAFERAGLYDDALIVLTSDHGEEFWEHGGTSHGRTVYQELLHVPLLIRLPGGKLHKRVRSRAPTQALLPTILELAGIDVPPQPGWAASLTSLLQEDAIDRYEAPIISGATHTDEFQWSVVMGRMKYIERRPSGREELYDLDADPGERISVLQQRPEIATAARRILEEHRAFATASLNKAGLVGGEEDEKWAARLRALGYIE